jgi:hypothetical protein
MCSLWTKVRQAEAPLQFERLATFRSAHEGHRLKNAESKLFTSLNTRFAFTLLSSNVAFLTELVDA